MKSILKVLFFIILFAVTALALFVVMAVYKNYKYARYENPNITLLESFNQIKDAYLNRNTKDSKMVEYNTYFTENDVHPKIYPKLNDDFTIKLGQVASFKEGFEVVFVGYEYGCGGYPVPDDIRSLIIKRAEASQCPPAYRPLFAVVKNGKVFVGYENYIQGYVIYDKSLGQDGQTIIRVSLLDKKEVKRLQEEEKKRILRNEANLKNN